MSQNHEDTLKIEFTRKQRTSQGIQLGLDFDVSFCAQYTLIGFASDLIPTSSVHKSETVFKNT